jgi:Tol biopolymer transport system component
VRPLNGTELATRPFWAPDSRSLGFFSDRKLKRIDIDSGLIQTVADAPIGAGGTWNDSGVLVFAPNVLSGLFRVSIGGVPQALTTLVPPQTAHRFPEFLPDGRHFLFFATGPASARGIYLASLDGGEPRRLLEADTMGAFLSPGHLLFVRQGALFAQGFDPRSLTLSGVPSGIATDIAADMTVGTAALSASALGAFAYRTGGPSGQRQLVWFDRSGQPSGTVGEPDGDALYNPDLSADARMVTVNRTAGIGQDIWQIDVQRGVQTRLTFDDASDQLPVWSPDGRQIVFASNRSTNVYDLYRKASSGTGQDEVLLQTSENKFPMGFSADGRFLLYRVTAPNVNWDLWALPMQGDPRPVAVTQTSFQEMMGEFAPDGRWVAYQSNQSGAYEIYVQSFPTPSIRTQISTSGGAQPRWRRDGKELFYIALDGRLMAASLSVDAQGQIQAHVPVPLFSTRSAGGPVPNVQKHQYAVAADGQRFLFNTVTDEAAAVPITFVLHWKPPK